MKATIASARNVLLLSLLIILLNHTACGAFRPPSIRDELGCSPTLSVLLGRPDWRTDPYFFDPLGISNDDNFPRLREAELKSGRVCMVAIVETMVVPLLRHLRGPNDGRLDLPTKAWDRLTGTTIADAVKVLLVCFVLETFVFVPKSPKDLPGDYGTGWFGYRDKGRHETLLIAELENGRLAMLALVAQLGLERLLDRSWDQFWLEGIRNWVDRL
jgi:Chlorophyll A-B binding protein